MIKFLQDAAGKGDLDPWDIDVISVIDSFLEQYAHTLKKTSNSKNSYQKDLSETSEAFFAASVLVNLKAQVLEADVFKENSSDFEDHFDVDDQDWIDQEFDIPKYPEKYLRRRSTAQPILKRTTTLGELVSQLESIAEVIESQDLLLMKRKRNKKYSNRDLVSQVKSLAHREKLPETTKELGKFIDGWEKALQWTDFEYLVEIWQKVVKNDLDKDRLGVFWALLFLSSENKIEIKQINSLYGPIQIKRIIPDGGIAQLPIENLEVKNTYPSAV
ncbi:Segregation and condensation protein A [Prochlorococcus marinus str. MIT 9321]|uniref:Segregation and condensation protein A n=1 Tax=Prochlorococcus marinus str. MIT 9401 TaxID=167551 RepID=A0A0A2B775_PROMR|nr:Segregation and condensation protein A [Prochlorococcus marinus str. MIT 9321]KGG06234.1 Segregation and condensation protein A [Prochlorococcus marinus str. MIT 9322]KGG09938.1 Segregation and condensation protein A [Prochlorococcus marinus str. MIT 9401]